MAIKQYKNYGPAFGFHEKSCDIFIHDKANINDNIGNIGMSYTHPDYPCQDQKSWTKFSGAIKSSTFKIK